MTPTAAGAHRVLPMGPHAVLIETADNEAALAVRAVVARAAATGLTPWGWVEESVVGARTLLLRLRDEATPEVLRAVERACADLLAASAASADGDGGLSTSHQDGQPDAPSHEQPGETVVVEIAVRYDGPDLDDVAALTGLTREEVVSAHTGTPWRVAFGGFAPGFAYLVGGNPMLRVPRRREPRARVPARSVALAGEYSGVYPQASPGGWQLIGTTEAPLWRTDREPPALLRPGAEVRFTAAELAGAHPAPLLVTTTSNEAIHPVSTSSAQRAHLRCGGRALEVLAAGPLTLVEDLGRRGLADVGVGRSGATDRAAYLLGLRLVGHSVGVGDADAPASLESTLGGLVVRAQGELLVAVTGADCGATVDGVAAPLAAPFVVGDGQVLAFGTPHRGLRSWLAVRGGIAAPVVLGSRSTDVLSGLGPPVVVVGDVLAVGPAPRSFPITEAAPLARAMVDGVVTLTMTAGPRADWCDLPDLADGGEVRTVSPRSDRSAIRLQGRPIRRSPEHRDDELPPEGMVVGAVQVPLGGEPVVFLADHPVTGGYPVIGVLTTESQARAAQLRPGDRVRLRLR